MARRALILVGGHRSIGLLYVKAAQRLGLDPITLSADPAQYDYLAAERFQGVRVDTDNLDALIRECSRLRATYDIAGITGFSGLDESIYAAVGKLCQHFDILGPSPDSIERCCDKFVQRQLLAKAGVPMPAYRLATDATEVESSATKIGLPVIVKPALGSGSCGVRLCRNVDELGKHTAHLLTGEPTWGSSPRILVEEFAQGPHYSAHIMGNEVVGIAATDFSLPPHFAVRESIFPATLTDDDDKHITDVSLSCLRALGLGWGATNMEFRWLKRGPVVIEVNPRLPGGIIPRVTQLAYGRPRRRAHLAGHRRGMHLRKRHSQTAVAQFLLPDSMASSIGSTATVGRLLYQASPRSNSMLNPRRRSSGKAIPETISDMSSPLRPPLLGQGDTSARRRLNRLVDTPFPTVGEQEQSAAPHVRAPALRAPSIRWSSPRIGAIENRRGAQVVRTLWPSSSRQRYASVCQRQYRTQMAAKERLWNSRG